MEVSVILDSYRHYTFGMWQFAQLVAEKSLGEIDNT